MKSIFSIIILFSSLAASAQENNSDVAGMPPQVAGVLNFPKQFFFFDITNTGWSKAPDDVTTHLISGGLHINFLYEFNLIGSRLGIAPGISYAVSGVKTNSIFEYRFSDDGNSVAYTGIVPFEDSAIDKSKLSVSYFEIPLEVHIHLKPHSRGRSFLIAPGFRAGIRTGDFWKVHYNSAAPGIEKAKLYNIENISNFRYGVSLRVMFYKFGLFGYYQLNPLFESGKGPAIMPYSVGVSISPF